MTYAIGVDMGATNISSALVSADGKILASDVRPTRPQESAETIINQLVDAIRAVKGDQDVVGVGIGMPGPLDAENGIVLETPNVPGLHHVRLQERLEEQLNLPIVLQNDVNVRALGVSMFGEGRHENDFVLVAPGTGVGGGIITHKTLHTGRGNAGEIGHLSVFPEGRPCSCGNQGCLEAYLGGWAIEREAQDRLEEDVTAKEVEKLAREGNAEARAIYEEGGRALGRALAHIINLLDPDAIYIGGSIGNAADIFLPIAEKEMEQYLFLQPVPIKSAMGEDNSVLGAASLIFAQQ